MSRTNKIICCDERFEVRAASICGVDDLAFEVSILNEGKRAVELTLEEVSELRDTLTEVIEWWEDE